MIEGACKGVIVQESIKQKLKKVEQQKTPEGYKNERGYIIPEDWQLCLLKDKFTRLTDKNPENLQNVLTISAKQGLIDQQDYFNHSYASEDKSNYQTLKIGDFSYNKSYSADYPFGAIKRLEKYDKGVVSPLYICFRPKESTNSDFYINYFEAGLFNREIYNVAQEGARNHGLLNVPLHDFFNTFLLNPPVLEQRRIAEILNLCDQIISLKRILIEEEQKRKNWLMQKLLKRKANYRKLRIREIAEVCTGATPSTKKPEYWDGDIRWMNSGELNLKRVCEVEGRITKNGMINSGAKLLPVGSVLIGLAGQGKTRGTVAMNFVPLCTNQSVAAILPNENFESDYLFWDLENRYTELRKLSSGDGARGGLNLELIKNLTVYLPTKDEQTDVASTLSSISNKISLLEQELAYWLQKKKALMLLLFTGIVRVSG